MSTEPNGLTTEVGERRVSFVVSEDLYPLDTIQGAAYLFLDRAYVYLDRPSERHVALVLKSKGEADAAALERRARGALAGRRAAFRLRLARRG